jgi:hypothetical protein
LVMSRGPILSEVPGPLSPGRCVLGLEGVPMLPLEGAVVLPVLEPCSRRQRVLAAPLSASQSLLVLAPAAALPEPIAVPVPEAGLEAVAGVSCALGPDAPLDELALPLDEPLAPPAAPPA